MSKNLLGVENPERPNSKTPIVPDDIWKVLNDYFHNTHTFLTTNQLDSYNTFISTQIPKTLRQFNPLDLTQLGGGDEKSALKMMSRDRGEINYQQRILVTVGGTIQTQIQTKTGINDYHIINDGSSITIGIPVLEEPVSGKIIKRQLFPNEARLRNLSYSSMLSSDIQIEFIREELIKSGKELETSVIPLDQYAHLLNISTDDNTTDLGVKQTIYRTETSIIRHFSSVPLGRIPVM